MKGMKSPTFYRKAPICPSVAAVSEVGGAEGGFYTGVCTAVSCSNREVGGHQEAT